MIQKRIVRSPGCWIVLVSLLWCGRVNAQAAPDTLIRLESALQLASFTVASFSGVVSVR